MLILFNFLLFQAVWFFTVSSAAAGNPVYGPGFTLAWMLVHLSFFTDRRLAEINNLLFAALLGYLMDSTQVMLGVIIFPQHTILGEPSPLWMIALWFNLAMTLNLSMKWLQNNLFLAAALGAVGGPAAYYGGEVLGAIVLNQPWSLLSIALQWFVAMPLLTWLARKQAGPKALRIAADNLEQNRHGDRI